MPKDIQKKIQNEGQIWKEHYLIAQYLVLKSCQTFAENYVMNLSFRKLNCFRKSKHILTPILQLCKT